MHLTDLQVVKLKPKYGRYEVADGGGLSVRVAPTGTKTWIYRYRFGGRPRRMTLGQYPTVGLAEARMRHVQAMRELDRGIDPGTVVVQEKAKLKRAPTINDMIEELWDMELKAKRSGPETRRLLEKDVGKAWGKRPVGEIKRRDIVLLLDGIARRGAPITRNRLHSALTRFFNFCAERGVIEDSPCTRIRKPSEAHKTRVLSDEELKAIWWALALGNENIDLFWTSKLALRFQMLTGQRSGEICGMAVDELDLEKGVWTIPAARMKNKQEHTLPLTGTMRGIIQESLTLFGGKGGFVFPSPRNKGPITRASLSRGIVRHRLEMGIKEPFSPHDIRRTVRTRMAEIGIDDVIAERVMGHKLQGMLAVYNQHLYIPEKLQTLTAWEKRLNSIVGLETDKAQVIAIGEGRRHA